MSGSRIEEAAFLHMRVSRQDRSEVNMARALLLIAELDGISEIARAGWVSPVTLRRQFNGTRQMQWSR
jgi:hypothetical protein